MRIISDSEIDSLLELDELLEVVEDAFVKQGKDKVVRPDRPHFPVGEGISESGDPLGTGLVMPAYIHGSKYYATKIVSVHESNPERGLDTVNAQIALNDAEKGLPKSYMAGNRITNARTGCIGGLGARELSVSGKVSLGVIGAGTQARWQTRAIAKSVDVEKIEVYSPSDSKHECAEELEEKLGIPASGVGTARDAVKDSDIVVTATTSNQPVFPADTLESGTLVIAVGAYTAEMQELESEVFEKASKVFADVPEEVAGIGDIAESSLTEEDLTPISSLFEGVSKRENQEEIIVVESVGTATLDAATAEYVYEKAEKEDIGVENRI